MAVLDRDTYMTRISELFPGDDDTSLSALEDLRDTYEAMAGNNRQAEIEHLMEENERLRRRYRDRFDQQAAEPGTDPGQDPDEKTTFDQLFT